MQATLLCRTGELSGKTYPLSTETIIGRGDGSNVVLSSDLISGRHASIRRDGNGYILEDLGSANGTWVDGERVTYPVRLDRLNVISLARAIDLIFHAEGVVPAAPAQAKPIVSPPSVAEPLPPTSAAMKPPVRKAGGPRPEVVIPASADPKATEFLQQTFGGLPALPALQRDAPPPPGRGETVEVGGMTLDVSQLPADLPAGPQDGSTVVLDGPFELPTLDSGAPTAAPVVYRLEINRVGLSTQSVDLMSSRRYTLGRAVDCDIPLDDPQLSRHHATVTVGEVVMVEDAGSRNGTHMSGRRLMAPAALAPGAAFMLASTVSVKLVAP